MGDARGKLGVQRECVEVDVLRGLRGVPGWCVRGLVCGKEEKQGARHLVQLGNKPILNSLR